MAKKYSDGQYPEEELDELNDSEMKELGEEERSEGIVRPKTAEEAGFYEDISLEEESEEGDGFEDDLTEEEV